MTDSVKTLEFKPGESITKYLRRAQEFKMSIEKNDYDTILDFLNDLLDLTGKFRMKSLTDFKRIKHDDVLFDADKNKNLLREYSSKFHKHLDYDLSDDTINKMKEDYLLYVLRDLLKKINYRLIRRHYDSGYYYTIKSQ